MDEYEATFSIDSKTDAYAVERLLEGLHDAVREESRSRREGTNDSSDVLAEFAALRDAARERRPGRLTVVYERDETGFGG